MDVTVAAVQEEITVGEVGTVGVDVRAVVMLVEVTEDAEEDMEEGAEEEDMVEEVRNVRHLSYFK